MITKEKKKPQKQILWKVQNETPKKKKKLVFPTQNPLPEIYIYR
jgi:hypothetical protein